MNRKRNYSHIIVGRTAYASLLLVTLSIPGIAIIVQSPVRLHCISTRYEKHSKSPNRQSRMIID